MNDFLEFLVRLAYQFGPFLFAVLFMVFIVKTAHTYNVEIANRPKEAPPQRKKYLPGVFCWHSGRWVHSGIYFCGLVDLRPIAIAR